MGRRNLRGRLELTWMGKDQALIPTALNTYDYAWVDRDDPRASQTHYFVDEGHVGDPGDGGLHDNLLITGDSGDVLETITRVPELADKYVGRVKCVYIDPPFNTGGVFTNYEDNLEHSVWLTFMRDRLVLLKQLLSDDGSIWVHLDHSENHRMRVLMDEVFGPGNFVAEFTWQKKTSSQSDSSGISDDTDVIITYANCKERFNPNGLPRSEASEAAYGNPDDDPRGNWREGDYKMESGSLYPIVHPRTGEEVFPPEGMNWRYSRETHEMHIRENRIWWGRTSNYRYPKFKRFRTDVADTRIANNLLLVDEVDSTRRAKTHIKDLFPGRKPFATPKPERLIERVLAVATNPGDLVLDCFAGSGTTAAVAHKMGRRWVTCELLEETVGTFTRPRLEKVIDGSDQGGISVETTYETVASLPNVSADEARTFAKLLGRTVKAIGAGEAADFDEDMPELDADTLAAVKVAERALKAATKTKKVTTQRWSGGGGFDVARLSPDWVGVEEDDFTGDKIYFTTPEATGEVLRRSVAGHLGFRYMPDTPRFCGVKERQRLAVIEGLFTEPLLDEFAAALGEGESMTVVCDGAPAGLARTMQKRVKGSRLLVMPDDLFTATRGGAR